MKIICVELVNLILSFIFALIFAKDYKLIKTKDSEGIRDELCNVSARIEDILEEQGEKIESYKVTATVKDGCVTYISVTTDRTKRVVRRHENKTDYSLKDRKISRWREIIFITLYYFILLSIPELIAGFFE